MNSHCKSRFVPYAVKETSNLNQMCGNFYYFSFVEFQNKNIGHLPGDTVGILAQNCDETVNKILHANPELKAKSHESLHLKIYDEAAAQKKIPKMPIYLPVANTTLYKLLQECVDLYAFPKKAFLSALVNNNCLNDVTERRFLEILASREGSSVYTTEIIQKQTTFYTLLNRLQSWNFTIENVAILFEHLPRLMPRPYSISNSPLTTAVASSLPDQNSTIFKIIFSLNNPPGITTGMLQQLIFKFEVNRSLKLEDSDQFVNVYVRQSNRFQLTDEDLEKPLIMIAIGTGIAPFIGFLEHIQEQRKLKNMKTTPFTWLIFGCRHKKKQLCESQLNGFLQNGILSKFSECFSRDANSNMKYVQDCIRSEAMEISNFLIANDENGMGKIFICGNKKMATDARTAIEEGLIKAEKCSAIEDAKQIVSEMIKSGRYIEDIWI